MMIRVVKVVIWLCGLVAISGGGIGVAWGQDAPLSQIFPDNPCALPCFFELRVGESTSQDVLHMLMDNLDTFLWRISVEDDKTQFDRETGYMTDGEYLAYWQQGNVSHKIQRFS